MIVVSDKRGGRVRAVADREGNARFLLAGGHYEATFPYAFTNHECGAGFETARAVVIAHHSTQVEIYCDDP